MQCCWSFSAKAGPKETYNGSGRFSALLVQIRTGKIGLASFLFYRRVTNISSPLCRRGTGPETARIRFLGLFCVICAYFTRCGLYCSRYRVVLGLPRSLRLHFVSLPSPSPAASPNASIALASRGCRYSPPQFTPQWIPPSGTD